MHDGCLGDFVVQPVHWWKMAGEVGVAGGGNVPLGAMLGASRS